MLQDEEAREPARELTTHNYGPGEWCGYCLTQLKASRHMTRVS